MKANCKSYNQDQQTIPLGKATPYITHYQPELLFAIPRATKRSEIGINNQNLPFQGQDIWNIYELSWLNASGKPMVATAEIIVPSDSLNIIESKSLKRYFNSFNNTHFADVAVVRQTILQDLTAASKAPIHLNLSLLSALKPTLTPALAGICLDHLDIACDTYTPQATYLTSSNNIVTETVYSDLLKSNCLVTGQPDWGSVQITYTGPQIHHDGLLQYIVSYRNHDEFHEQCVERMFMDIMRQCQPQKLCVYARYTRRGGIDINPYRANYPVVLDNTRLWRQ